MRLAVILARGGSKRIPRKNVRPFAGKPIIAHSIDAARACGLFDHVVVSTDDDEIAQVARACGAETPFVRPADLADGHTGTNAVVRHAIGWFGERGELPDHVRCLYATAPFVQPRHSREGFEQLVSSGKSFAFSVTTFAFPIQRALRIDADGCVQPIWPENVARRSQDLEETYHDAGQACIGARRAPSSTTSCCTRAPRCRWCCRATSCRTSTPRKAGYAPSYVRRVAGAAGRLMRIALRTDASGRTGTGHLMRCLTLADTLRAGGARTRFVCRPLPAGLGELVAGRGHELASLPPGSDAVRALLDPPHAEWLGATRRPTTPDATLAALAGEGTWDWLVVDHYALDARWEARLRSVARRILAIDDLADRRHDCDALLDQNFYADGPAR
ncbi:MAG: pseudaminic acid cytidylyltransferase [Burkholderiaceae bacterium]